MLCCKPSLLILSMSPTSSICAPRGMTEQCLQEWGWGRCSQVLTAGLCGRCRSWGHSLLFLVASSVRLRGRQSDRGQSYLAMGMADSAVSSIYGTCQNLGEPHWGIFICEEGLRGCSERQRLLMSLPFPTPHPHPCPPALYLGISISPSTTKSVSSYNFTFSNHPLLYPDLLS